jgi:type IV pilus biogenesis protein CpaD/CtpE
MRRILLGAIIVLLSGCAAKRPAEPAPGAETVRVETSHPGAAFFELGPVSGTDGQGCGDEGLRGKRDRAVASLMKNAFAMGGTHVQVMALYEPRQMGDCFVNIYRVSGTAYRQAKATSVAPGSDVVQQLRDLQRMRQEGTISEQDYERLKARIIGG